MYFCFLSLNNFLAVANLSPRGDIEEPTRFLTGEGKNNGGFLRISLTLTAVGE